MTCPSLLSSSLSPTLRRCIQQMLVRGPSELEYRFKRAVETKTLVMGRKRRPNTAA